MDDESLISLVTIAACVFYAVSADLLCTWRLARIYGSSWKDSKIRQLAERPFMGVVAFLIYFFGVNPPKDKSIASPYE